MHAAGTLDAARGHVARRVVPGPAGGTPVGGAAGAGPGGGEPGPDLAALAAMRSLHRAAGAVRRRLEGGVLHDAGLSWTAFEVLRVLWVHGAAAPRAVAVEVGVSAPTLSGVAATLERRGLLARRPLPQDRRLAVLEPTATGRHLVTDLLPAVADEEADALRCLDPVARDALTGMLERVTAALRPDPDPPA